MRVIPPETRKAGEIQRFSKSLPKPVGRAALSPPMPPVFEGENKKLSDFDGEKSRETAGHPRVASLAAALQFTFWGHPALRYGP